MKKLYILKTSEGGNNMSKREKLIDTIATQWLSEMDTDALMDFFYENQVEYLNSLTDSDINDVIDNYEMDLEYLK